MTTNERKITFLKTLLVIKKDYYYYHWFWAGIVPLANAQNVGIGTNAPQDKLHVTGGNVFINSATGGLKLGYPVTTGINFWEFVTIDDHVTPIANTTWNAMVVRQ